MVTVDRLLQHPKKRDRVLVELSDGRVLDLSASVAGEAGLLTGRMASEGVIADAVQADERHGAWSAALAYLGPRPRSVAEVRRKLAQRGVSEATADEVVERLQREGYSSDELLARFWVENRDASSPRGARALRHELRNLGVSREAIETTISSDNDEARAHEAATHRLRAWGALADEEFRQKMEGFLQRRGFDYEIIRNTVRRLLEEREA